MELTLSPARKKVFTRLHWAFSVQKQAVKQNCSAQSRFFLRYHGKYSHFCKTLTRKTIKYANIRF